MSASTSTRTAPRSRSSPAPRPRPSPPARAQGARGGEGMTDAELARLIREHAYLEGTSSCARDAAAVLPGQIPVRDRAAPASGPRRADRLERRRRRPRRRPAGRSRARRRRSHRRRLARRPSLPDRPERGEGVRNGAPRRRGVFGRRGGLSRRGRRDERRCRGERRRGAAIGGPRVHDGRLRGRSRGGRHRCTRAPIRPFGAAFSRPGGHRGSEKARKPAWLRYLCAPC